MLDVRATLDAVACVMLSTNEAIGGIEQAYAAANDSPHGIWESEDVGIVPETLRPPPSLMDPVAAHRKEKSRKMPRTEPLQKRTLI